MVLLAIIVLLGAVVALVTRPLRGGAREAESAEAARTADLLAARDAKYREIRELEPHAAGLVALHSPATAITDYAAVAETMAGELRAGGGDVRV